MHNFERHTSFAHNPGAVVNDETRLQAYSVGSFFPLLEAHVQEALHPVRAADEPLGFVGEVLSFLEQMMHSYHQTSLQKKTKQLLRKYDQALGCTLLLIHKYDCN